ncbi:hypothetical protein COMA1_10104 [Candidatus Nitrospira nitrosa]|uniref:Uncharacterized protein n=1 Tax=Candidatus Nitrospira nitrosa TaxID=1742972 RepID=A0A0S4L418_9BACT|nr:hypothetical protein COMA1_10104 [Candidatus Nitrospira nitrosa]
MKQIKKCLTNDCRELAWSDYDSIYKVWDGKANQALLCMILEV